MKPSWPVWIGCLLVILSLAAPAAVRAGQAEVPPLVAEVFDMQVLAVEPAMNPEGLLFWVPTDRGYYAVFMNLEPSDPRMGSGLLALDIETDRQRLLARDVNSFDERAASPTAPGHQLAAVAALNERDRAEAILLGTTARQGETLDPATYPGGLLLVYRRHGEGLEKLAQLEPGWSVHKFADHGARAMSVLARWHDGTRYRLLRLDDQGQLHPTGIEGGPSLRGIALPQSGQVFYQDDQGTIRQVNLTQQQSDVTLVDDPSEALQYRTSEHWQWFDSNDQTIGPRNYQSAAERWGRSGQRLAGLRVQRQQVYELVETMEVALPEAVIGQTAMRSVARPLLRARAGYETPVWTQGLLYGFAHEPDGVRLLAVQAGAAEVIDLGHITLPDGRVVDRVDGSTTDNGGHLLLLARVGQTPMLLRMRLPQIDLLMQAQEAAHRAQVQQQPVSPILFESLADIADFGWEQDRNWDPLFTGSDGHVYFGTMPHHATKGSLLFGYNVQDNTLNVLGDFDALTSNKGPDDLPNMVHLTPVELDGVLYWSGQDPFYGQRHFVTHTPQARYHGSSLLAYDLNTGAFSDLGRPLGEENIFGLLPAPTRQGLYLSQDYRRSHWHFHDLTSGQTRRLDLPNMGKHQHVDSAGRLIFVEGASGKVMRFDPADDSLSVVARITGDDLPGAPSPQENQQNYFNAGFPFMDTLGQDQAIAVVGNFVAVVRIDLKAGRVHWLGQFQAPENARGAYRAFAIHDNVLYAIFNANDNVRRCYLASLDLATGTFTQHGLLYDTQGRLVRESNAATTGGDGAIYLNATLWPRSGERGYSTRFAAWQGHYHVNVLGRLKLPADASVVSTKD